MSVLYVSFYTVHFQLGTINEHFYLSISGADAPAASNLKAWLKEHPTYEVVKSNNSNTYQLGGKTLAAIQSQGIKTVRRSDFICINEKNKSIRKNKL